MGIVERLRSDAEDHVEVANSCDCNPQDTVNWRHAETAHEAANEIEQLRARVAELESRASPASVPEGWKLVPIEATMEMCEAGWNEYDLQEHFSVRFMYERMIAVAPTPPVSEDRWLPIETAPKDGTRLLLAKIGRDESECGVGVWWACTGNWSDQWKNWNDGIEPCGLSAPTHWMPLPKAPAMQEDKS